MTNYYIKVCIVERDKLPTQNRVCIYPVLICFSRTSIGL